MNADEYWFLRLECSLSSDHPEFTTWGGVLEGTAVVKGRSLEIARKEVEAYCADYRIGVIRHTAYQHAANLNLRDARVTDLLRLAEENDGVYFEFPRRGIDPRHN